MSHLFGNHIVGFPTRRLTCSHFHGRTIHHGTNGIISVNHVRVNQALSFIIGHDRIQRLSVCLLIKFQTKIWPRMVLVPVAWCLQGRRSFQGQFDTNTRQVAALNQFIWTYLSALNLLFI